MQQSFLGHPQVPERLTEVVSQQKKLLLHVTIALIKTKV